MIEEATEADIDQYANVKSGFGIEDVIGRFEWNAENKVSWYVYRIERKVVGWVNMNWGGMKRDSECPDLFDLYVIPSQRSRGIGTQMVQYCETLAVTRGFTKIGLCVNPDANVRAMKLYEQLGYTVVGERYLDGVYNGYEDWTIDMKKDLTSR